MIVPMIKYDFLLFHSQKEEFLEKLQDLGLVDITTRGWEPDDKERELILAVEKQKTAVNKLRQIASEPDFTPTTPYSSGREAYEAYRQATSERDSIEVRLQQAESDLTELKAWGEFNADEIRALEARGIFYRYFHVYSKEFSNSIDKWSENYTVVPISEDRGTTYFIVVTDGQQDLDINAIEMKAPTEDYNAKEAEIEQLKIEYDDLEPVIMKAASSIDMIEEYVAAEMEKIDITKASSSAVSEAEGSLLIMEGWAQKETSANLDAALEQVEGLYYIKSDPTPEDDTPVKLKNGKVTKLFEFIGNFYSLPKYGSMDLTPFFGWFYILFFGICLADAGYGLLLLLGGTYMLYKASPNLKGVSRLVMLCGFVTMLCGFMMGSFFGIPLAELPAFVNFRSYFLSTDNLFYVALGIGVFQILFAMCLKVVNLTMQYGFRYSLSTIGWMIVIVALLLKFIPEAAGYPQYELGQVPFLITTCIGLFMMLFLNSPGKNPFANFGAGLWNTYNDVTGLLSDVLSYIRLFAIGLSGGVLATVFNDLAVGLSPNIPVVKQLVIIIILLIGHGINLFMSTLSSFVHPMRLTFVEFYKNAGFEATQRKFEPLKRFKNNN